MHGPAEPHRIDLTNAWDPPATGDRWTRSFGRPAGIAAEDRIWLVIDGAAIGGVELNGAALEPADAVRHDVTGRLRPRNLLAFTGVGNAPAAPATAAHGRCRLPTSFRSVRLEIESRG